MSDTSPPADFVDASRRSSGVCICSSILGGHTTESTTQKDAGRTPPELGSSVGCREQSTSGSEGVGDDDLDLVSQNPTKLSTCRILNTTSRLLYAYLSTDHDRELH